MKSFNHLIYLVILAIFASPPLLAEECSVNSSDGLKSALAEIAQNGGCETKAAFYKERYESFRGTSLKFHVIKFNANIEITSPVECLNGQGGNPVVIIASDGNSVTLKGAICLGSQAILDNINLKDGKVKITGAANAVVDSKLSGSSITVSGEDNWIVGTEISKNTNNGLELYGDNNRVSKTYIRGNTGFGIRVNGSQNRITESKIENNQAGGIFIKTCDEIGCESIHTALISKTSFINNGLIPISIETWPLPSPINLVTVETATEWKVTGNLGEISSEDADNPWININKNALQVELFIKDGPFVASTDDIDPVSGQFVFTVENPITIDGIEYKKPVFVATTVDYENNNTSPFSGQIDSLNQDDMDGDGIANEQEDYNHNGMVDYGETDPRNSDTDNDGLTDGEERLHTGRVEVLIKKGILFSDFSKLSPTNPDSDGDCINDGLELGVGSSPENAIDAMKSIVAGDSDKKNSEMVSAYCKAILKKHGVLTTGSSDIDPQTNTDPTSADTDNDGLKDGEEDWNFNGKLDDGETDPNLPDTDGDGLLDGSEGDKNQNDKLDENETDPALKDTDDDGINDGEEVNKYGSMPNSCDSDADGLADGIEANKINPNPKNPECTGLQTAGTNFAAIDLLSPIKSDSDGDGVSDGEEDVNLNGWLDLNETDPTVTDTDDDAISDYTESSLDIDGDGIQDIDISMIDNGKKCAPPQNINDLDCDGIINARDMDSDDDGCTDNSEGLNTDKDSSGIPDVYESSQANCGSTGGGGVTPAPVTTPPPSQTTPAPIGSHNKLAKGIAAISHGGGACSLVAGINGSNRMGQIFLIFLPVLLITRRLSIQPKKLS